MKLKRLSGSLKRGAFSRRGGFAAERRRWVLWEVVKGLLFHQRPLKWVAGVGFFSYNGFMNTAWVLSLFREFGQAHILEHLETLPPDRREGLLAEALGYDLPRVFELFRRHSAGEGKRAGSAGIEPAAVIGPPGNAGELRRREEARRLGEEWIAGGKTAVLIVAGGQGSRLGFEGPKGMCPVSPLARKPLFRLFAEGVAAVRRRYGADVPLVVMTSRENDGETRKFFRENDFWGLAPRVHFFSQGMLPTLTLDGRLILREPGRLLANPDGHGGSLKAFSESGLLAKLLDEGFTQLFYCQVDNPLVKMADPVFLGYHRLAEADISTKVVRRRDAEEKVGIYGLLNGKPGIIEYSDFPPGEYRAADGKGNLRHWAGNIAVHVLSLSFIERLNRRGFALPYHRAVKEVEAIGRDGRPEKTKGLKFESFVFDAIPLAERSCCLEALREEEFAPVKNREGADSPETAREAMVNLHRRWLAEAGVEVAPEATVEISPLFALDKEELGRKVKGKRLKIKDDLYLDETSQF
jgi:UDP-N-acetylglucosamine/UDP-N-acetylgalactosamine diphosphorylase